MDLIPALILGIVLFPTWTTVHEGSHAVAMLSQGDEVTEFHPYVHVEGDRLRMGDVHGSGTGTDLVRVIPYVVDLLTATVILAVTQAIDCGSHRGVCAFLSVLALGPVIDSISNLQSGIRGYGDLSERSYLYPIPILAATVGLTAIGLSLYYLIAATQ